MAGGARWQLEIAARQPLPDRLAVRIRVGRPPRHEEQTVVDHQPQLSRRRPGAQHHDPGELDHLVGRAQLFESVGQRPHRLGRAQRLSEHDAVGQCPHRFPRRLDHQADRGQDNDR